MLLDHATFTQILLDNSTTKFHIEYGGSAHLANHISHGIIALYRLGASEEKILRFVAWYQHKLEPKEESKVEWNPEELLGKQKGFDQLVKFYLSQFKGSLKELIQETYPKLSSGVCSALLHGIIHLGYGLSVSSAQITCEGLAFMHHSFVSPKLSPGQLSAPFQGTEEALTVLQELRQDERLMLALERWKTEGFLNRWSQIFSTESETLLHLVDKIALPPVSALGDHLFHLAVVVYAGSSRKNDFFFLHGVTAAWSLREVLRLLSDPSLVVAAVRVFLIDFLSIFGSVGAPEIDPKVVEACPAASWEEIIEEALVFEVDRDEHAYKLVQSCHDTAKEQGFQNDGLLKAAAQASLSYKLNFDGWARK